MKPSPQMIRVLQDVRDGFGAYSTATGKAFGGRYRTARALRHHGLLDFNHRLTEAGKAALAAAEQAGKEPT
jgi:hypothetical protein